MPQFLAGTLSTIKTECLLTCILFSSVTMA